MIVPFLLARQTGSAYDGDACAPHQGVPVDALLVRGERQPERHHVEVSDT